MIKVRPHSGFHKPTAVRLTENTGNFSAISRRFPGLGLLRRCPDLPTGNFSWLLSSHIHTGAVDGNLVDKGVRTWGNKRIQTDMDCSPVIGTLTGKQLAFFGDVHRLPVLRRAGIKAQRIQR